MHYFIMTYAIMIIDVVQFEVGKWVLEFAKLLLLSHDIFKYFSATSQPSTTSKQCTPPRDKYIQLFFNIFLVAVSAAYLLKAFRYYK